MAELNNLTEENVSELRKFFVNKIQSVNPKAKLSFLTMPEDFEEPGGCEGCKKEIQELKNKVDDLLNKINHIFGDSFLYNGEFMSVKDQEVKKTLGL